MSSVSSTPCVVEKCDLVSLALCQCCNKILCIDHLNEHASQRNEKLLPFVDKVNVLINSFNHFYDSEKSGLKQLDEWRQEAYKLVDNYYETKRQEFIGETTGKHRAQLDEMNTKLKDLIRKKGGTQQDFDSFSENMRSMEQHLDNLQQLQINILPLTIDSNCILRPVPSQQPQNNSTDKTLDNPNKSPEHADPPLEKSTHRKKSSEKSSKKKKKSSRHSDDSSDRSSRHRSRSPRSRTERSRRKRGRSSESNSSSNNKDQCDDCRDCRFYQDRFGPGFMDSFGPCSCECHKWAYS